MTRQHTILTPEEIWRRYDADEQRLTAPLSEAMLDLAGIRPGMRVLDLAAGRGEPAIRAARRVGPQGSVLGVDVSESMLQMTRERAAGEGVSNLDLRVMNAEALDVDACGRFDAVLARWCLMYFGAPVVALAAARRAMLPGARLVAAVWAEPERVSYHTLPRRILARHWPVPPVDPDAPGTFYYADPDRLRRDFAAAGLAIDHTEEREVAAMESDTAVGVIDWVCAFGLARLLADVPQPVRQAWEAEMAQEAEALRRDGWIRLGGVTRIVVARGCVGH